MNPVSMIFQMVSTFIIVFWWVIPIAIMIAFFKSPFMKGVLGEFQVNLAAHFFLDKRIYTLFKNVTLRTEDGSTQIDHIIVSRYGVFVIETKNMTGWIFGSPRQKIWTQKIYRHSSTFQNPLHQNYKHTQGLQAVLQLDPDKIFSVVVFVGGSTFKTAMPDNVVNAGGYIRFIKSKREVVLTDNEALAICTRIQTGRLKPPIKTHFGHVNHVKEIVEKKQQKVDSSCPRCGKPMVLRTTKAHENQGKQFWGCSGFPKCRNIRPMI